MSYSIQIRKMTEADIAFIHKGLYGHDVSKPLEYIHDCYEQNLKEERVTLLALYEGEFAGWGHVVLRPEYPYFAESGIPEIQNFDIIPPLRRRGIGGLLFAALEEKAFAVSETIGIGFGLYADYGTAQRLYIKRGFVPDGKGVMYNYRAVEPGREIPVDDDLNLFLVKSKPKL
ncbi:GNAT family N-acetyltransferase [Paenibacillus sp. PK3_47]|nr:GNAT family N-acetyltransferase [Paenibacillus sp. PK3_47]